MLEIIHFYCLIKNKNIFQISNYSKFEVVKCDFLWFCVSLKESARVNRKISYRIQEYA